MPRAEGVAVNFLPDFKLAAPKYFRVATPDSNRTLGINPPEPTSAPLRPYWKKSESKGCVIAMLLGFAGLIFLGALGGSGGLIEDAPLLFYVASLPAFFLFDALWPILLIGGIVSGGVSLGRMKRWEIGDQPPKEDATPAPEDEPEDAEE